MVGTDSATVHRFRSDGRVCAAIEHPSGVSRFVGNRPIVRCAFGFVGKGASQLGLSQVEWVRAIVSAVHNTASPESGPGLAQLFASR